MRSRVPASVGFVAALVAATASGGVGVWTTNGPPNGAFAVATGPAGFIYTTNARSTDGGATWTDNGLGPVGTCVAAGPPGTVYIGADSMLYKSSDAGASWNSQLFQGGGQLTSFVTVDQRAASTVYVGSTFLFNAGHVVISGDLWKSTDGGVTWAGIFHVGAGSGPVWTPLGSSLAIDPSNSNVLYLSQAGTNYKSLDGGSSWTQLPPLPGSAAQSWISAWVVDPSSPGTMYVGTSSGIFKSTDGGSSFVATNTGLVNSQVSSLAIAPVYPYRLYAGTGLAYSPGTGGGVFVSENGGASWQPMATGLTDPIVIALAIDSSGRFIHAATESGVFDYEQVRSECSTATTLCLNAGRFAVTADFQGTAEGPSAPAKAVPLTGDTGYFWFFDAANVELVVKVLTGCAVNADYWVFAGGLTNVGVELRVTDTQTGLFKTYSNAAGTPFKPIQDSSAFPCP